MLSMKELHFHKSLIYKQVKTMSINENVKFSIIIPVYNSDEYLEECIESVLNQTYKNFEVILINDGSKDKSGSICDNYSKIETRLKVIHQENKGRVLARRKGIENATGDYLLFLDSDDYWDINLLETIYKYVVKFNCDMIIFKYKRVFNNIIVREQQQLFDHERIFENDDKKVIFEKIISTSSLNNLVTKVIKKTIVDNCDYLHYKDIRNGEDLLQSLPWLYRANKIVYINKPLYNYRINPKSTTQNFDVNRINDLSIVRGVFLKYMKKLRIDTYQNMCLFYSFFLDRMISYIIELINSDIERQKKYYILNKLKQNEHYINSFRYLRKYESAFYKKIILYLFNRKHFVFLNIYIKILNKLKVLYRKLTKKPKYL